MKGSQHVSSISHIPHSMLVTFLTRYRLSHRCGCATRGAHLMASCHDTDPQTLGVSEFIIEEFAEEKVNLCSLPPTLPSPPSPLPSPSPYLKGRSRRIRHPFEPPHLLSAQAKAEHSNDHGQTILHPPRQVTTTIIIFGRCCGTRGWSEATAVIACTWGVTSKEEALPLISPSQNVLHLLPDPAL